MNKPVSFEEGTKVSRRPPPPDLLTRELPPIPHENDTLNSSTPSLPLSIPYGYIANNTNSFDTVNLLSSVQNSQPMYSNTLHINLEPSSNPLPAKMAQPGFVSGGGSQSQVQGSVNTNKVTPSSVRMQKTPMLEEELVNQVPKRFLQFILDQQNPFMVQKIDGISMNSLSLYLGDPYVEQRGKTSSDDTHSKKRSVDRDISDSMGSQATIFSTRGGAQEALKSTFGGLVYSGTPLKRKKALRAPTLAIHRIKQKFRLLGSRIKRFFIRRRKVKGRRGNAVFSSTRVSSNAPRYILRKKSRGQTSVSTRKASKPRRIMNISAPINNPALVDRTNDEYIVERAHLNKDLKIQAGAPLDMLLPGHEVYSSSHRETEESHHRNSNGLKGASKTVQIAPEKTKQPTKQPTDTHSIDCRKPSAAISSQSVVKLDELYAVRKSLQAPILDDSLEEATVELWKSYLMNVLASRIKLRQEINYFQLLKKDNTYNWDIPEENTTERNHHFSSIYDDTSLDPKTKRDYTKWSTYSQQLLETSAAVDHFLRTVLVKTQVSQSEYESDPEVAEFQQTVRHSMLGEMLDYNSDATSVASVATSSNTIISNDDLGIGARYGTVIRRLLKLPEKLSNLLKLSHLSKATQLPIKSSSLTEKALSLTEKLIGFSTPKKSRPPSPPSPLKRSPGFAQGLHV